MNRRNPIPPGGQPEGHPAADDVSCSAAGNDEACSERSGLILKRAGGELERLLGQPLEPGLYLVATPIGNLADITLRALAVLATADVVYAEDTRHSGRLLSHFGIRAKLRPYHEHNAERERPNILASLKKGQRIALISDAGTPLVSDPGFKLVRACAAAGYLVTSLPGPSAVLAAVVSSGLPTDAFLFAGFLPSRQQARQTRIRELAAVPHTLVLFEASSRVAATLADLAHLLGDRPAVVARELTKLNEEMARGRLSSLVRDFAERETVKGELVIVIGPPQALAASEAEIEERLLQALAELSLRDAAKAVSIELGVPRKRVYDIGLRLRRDSGESGSNDERS